jgi:glycosyltransferase involved in cell wall biosynthesis
LSQILAVKVFINAVSAKLGGAATYVRNLAASLAEMADPADEFVFVVPPEREREMPAGNARVRVLASSAAGGSYAARWWWEQVTLRRLLARERPSVLFSSANFAMLACPCPQILLVRIPIYFDRGYLEHVLPTKSAVFRAETALRRWLVCRSVAVADCLMTPTAAMRDDLARFARLNSIRTVVNPYGVPRRRVASTSAGFASRDVHAPDRPLRLLWVSHYADHKNLATLLRAVLCVRDLLRHAPGGAREVELLLTLDPALEDGQHTPLPSGERALLRELGDRVKLLGVQPYERVWELYREADVFVFPSLCESFGHPLVEAMAAGLPIVASDIPVHREICAQAALYFPVQDAEALAAQIASLATDVRARQGLAQLGRQRVESFVWEDHVMRLLQLWRELASC